MATTTTYLDIESSGRITRQTAVQTSAGAGDANKILRLDSTGKIDNSMMPTGIGADTASIVASEALSAGDFVNLWNNAGAINARKADATTSGKEADGFVLSAVSASASATVYFEGTNTQRTGLTAGSRYYLATTAGSVTTTPPSTAGNVVQYIGKAISTTAISFESEDGIIL